MYVLGHVRCPWGHEHSDLAVWHACGGKNENSPPASCENLTPPRSPRGVVSRSASDQLDRVLHCAMSCRGLTLENGGRREIHQHMQPPPSSLGLLHRLASDHFDRAVHCSISGRPSRVGHGLCLSGEIGCVQSAMFRKQQREKKIEPVLFGSRLKGAHRKLEDAEFSPPSARLGMRKGPSCSSEPSRGCSKKNEANRCRIQKPRFPSTPGIRSFQE